MFSSHKKCAIVLQGNSDEHITSFEWALIVVHEYLHIIGFNSDARVGCDVNDEIEFYREGLLNTLSG